ncbi:alpha/beta fold hydrolase [Phormidium pseudopriestleyi FRX01]|uniref:Alpha/beta fold hydrolase n=1 Tax=Phormidium pseudopriestleyi FRX01 TaxID=1759528 RepID=A0ABS3FVS9_9CYAN|nr:alpha/beta fold hydrolase [Phormidium pseudopriestleyi]MBO0351224.1 alpha/beta fold hydrolase [Phormidium pseudopriestleyi FRX01]
MTLIPSNPSASSPSAPLPFQTWTWRGFPICYQQQGEAGPAVVLVHGFGASCGHWRKNIPDLATGCRVYAIDLIGFGYSAKPTPGEAIAYTFETWGEQLADFCREIVGGPAFFVGNSIGCIAIMQAAVDHPELAKGIVAINCSLRLLHDRKRSQKPWYQRIGPPIAQKILSVKWIAQFFFKQLATAKTVRSILLQAYRRSDAVTDELVEIILGPSRDAGAVDVFVAFTRYSQGPLPEDLLPILPCPALLLWGSDDPWEPLTLGQEFAQIPTVDKFIPLPGLGHCPQDEAPEVVNPIVLEWILGKEGKSNGLV